MGISIWRASDNMLDAFVGRPVARRMTMWEQIPVPIRIGLWLWCMTGIVTNIILCYVMGKLSVWLEDK